MKKKASPRPAPSSAQHEQKLSRVYNLLYRHFGPQHWWPGETSFEIAVGAILTQNTNWGNVERAITNLKAAGPLTAGFLCDLPEENLGELLRPAGYFRVKAKRLRAFLSFLIENYGGEVERMVKEETDSLRKKLLSVHGIGEETADSILLYAGGHPIFVVDAYTRRFGERHRLFPARRTYGEIQAFFTAHLPRDEKLYNEYHALLVALGKYFCRPKSRCAECPLNNEM